MQSLSQTWLVGVPLVGVALVATGPGCGDPPAAIDSSGCVGGACSADAGGKAAPADPCADGSCEADAGEGVATADAPACVPSKDACAGKCGTQFDECGSLRPCGSCAAGQVCGGGGPNVCGFGTCTPSCDGKVCGDSDGCGDLCEGPCKAPNHGTATCQAGICTTTCNQGYVACATGCCPGACGPGNCDGCCGADGACTNWETPAACGVGGAACQKCASGLACDHGACGPSCVSQYERRADACVYCGVAVLFGGIDATGYAANTWFWNGTSWQMDGSSGPSLRTGHAMAALEGGIYDSGVVLFGGMDSSGHYLSDTWMWDFGWRKSNASGPQARAGHAMAMRRLSESTFLFGGADAGTDYGDTWEWDGLTWTERTVTGPSPRHGHVMAALRDKVVLFGGQTIGSSALLGDTWEWDGSTWTQRAIGAVAPPPSATARAVTWNAGHKVLLFGDDGATWTWDGASWSKTAESGPLPRSGFGAATLAGDATLLFGGTNGGPLLGDTWERSSGAWSQRDTSGLTPRREHVMVGWGSGLYW